MLEQGSAADEVVARCTHPPAIEYEKRMIFQRDGAQQLSNSTDAVPRYAKRLRVLIADDNPEIREYLQVYLRPDHDVVGSIADGHEVLRRVFNLHPDILLLDISMPGLSGFKVARRLRQDKIQIRIIFVTAHAEPAYLREANRIGVEGYVLKGRARSELLAAIKQVEEGASYVSPELR